MVQRGRVLRDHHDRHINIRFLIDEKNYATLDQFSIDVFSYLIGVLFRN